MANRYQFIISFTVAAVLVIIIHLTRPPSKDARMMQEWFWAMKTHDVDDVELIVYGDSRVSQAVDTRPLQVLFPDLTPRNLGYRGAGFNRQMYDHLLSVLQGPEPRKVVILGITPYGLSTEALENEQFEEELHRSKSEVAFRLLLNPILGLFEPLTPSMYRDADSKSGEYITYHPDGWQETYVIPENPGKWLPVYRRHFDRTQVDQANIDATYEFIRNCHTNQITVYGFRPPSTREMEQIENEESGFNEASFVNGFEDAGGIWLEFTDRFAYYSYDGSHLHYKAAKQFSRHLAAAIKSSMAESQAD